LQSGRTVGVLPIEDDISSAGVESLFKNESFGVDIAHLDEEDVALARKKRLSSSM
jgi:hypothetical protein